jgi:hypothetical protein
MFFFFALGSITLTFESLVVNIGIFRNTFKEQNFIFHLDIYNNAFQLDTNGVVWFTFIAIVED